MKNLFLALSIVFASVAVFAQQDQKAKEILDRVSTKTKAFSTVKVKFEFTRENIEEKTKESSTGELNLKGNKYVLAFLNNTIICDSKTIWTYMKEANEVTVSNLDEKESSVFNPAKMLTIYETGFKYKYIQERFDGGRALHVIDLFPIDIQKSEYSRVRLEIDKDKDQIYRVSYFSKDENRFYILVKEMKTNADMPDTMFGFDKSKYAGVEIVDMRE